MQYNALVEIASDQGRIERGIEWQRDALGKHPPRSPASEVMMLFQGE